MLISTKGRYALRVMIDLAEHQTDAFISLKDIAQRQEISDKYLESIIRMLVKARVLKVCGARAAAISCANRRKPTRWAVFCG